MRHLREQQDQALEAIGDAMRSLADAQAALQRAHAQMEGEAADLSASMSQQLHFLMGVAELLSVEIRQAAGAQRKVLRLMLVKKAG
jgi:hypothetical protein